MNFTRRLHKNRTNPHPTPTDPLGLLGWIVLNIGPTQNFFVLKGPQGVKGHGGIEALLHRVPPPCPAEGPGFDPDS